VVGIDAAELDVESLRFQVRKMGDEELLRFGREVYMLSETKYREAAVKRISDSI